MNDDADKTPLFDFSRFEAEPEPPAARSRATHTPSEPADTSDPSTLFADRPPATHTHAPSEPADAFDPSALFPSGVFDRRSVLAAPVPRRLGFEPAIEGLRGVAVLAAILYLADVPFFGGGFLALSTFLTLTGFLVTRNLLGRLLDGERLFFGPVAGARLRRIMPIAVLGVAAAVLFTVTVGDVGQVNRVFGDSVTSLAYLSNWRFAAQSQSYLSLLASPSALQSYWSLAVAEQLHVIVLLVLLGAAAVVRRANGGRGAADPARTVRVFTVLVGVLIALSLASTLLLGHSHSRVYLGTDTRASELLLGAVLALVLVHRPGLSSSRFAPAIAMAGGIAALAALLLWMVTPISSPWVYEGGLVAYALVSMAIIAACLVPRSPLATVLGYEPLRWVGRLSYGMYVFAWPVILLLSPERTHLPAASLLAARLFVIVAVAMAAHRYVESPVQAGQLLYGFRPASAIGGMIAVIMLTTLATASDAPAPAIDLSQPYTAAGSAYGDRTSTPVLAVFGDSTAIPIQRGLTTWVDSTNRAVSRQGRFAVGCGVVPGGAWQLGATNGDTPASCDELQKEWSDALEPGAPTMAIVTPGLLELANRQLPGDDRWRAIGVPEVEGYYLKQMLAVTDTLAGKGAKVVWLTMPPVVAGTQYDARPSLGQATDPARAQRLNELIGEVARQRPDKVAVIDVAGWLQQHDPDGHLYRPDGLHLSDDGAKFMTESFLGPELLKLAGIDPNTLPGIGPSSSALARPECVAIRSFTVHELAAASTLADRDAQASDPATLALEREQAQSSLASIGGQLQQFAPELRDAVDARLAFWTKALATPTTGTTGAGGAPSLREPQDAQLATSVLKAYEAAHCH